MIQIKRAPVTLSTIDEPWAGDKFGRDQFGIDLIELINTHDQPMSIGLCSVWGSGKTDFLYMLRNKIRKEADIPFLCVRFDAWTAETYGDPLVGFTLALQDELEHLKSSSEKAQYGDLQKTVNFVLKAAKKVVAAGKSARSEIVGAAAGALAEAMVPAAGLSAAATKATVSSVDVTAQKLLDQLVSKQFTGEAARLEFRKSIEALVATNRNLRPGDGCRLLIMIDELDRCRPDYSIQVLERIKHYFDLPGVVFLLAYDSGYLNSAAQTVYGPQFSSDAYFRKLIDYELALPKVDSDTVLNFIFASLDFSSLEKRSSHNEVVSETYHALNSLMKTFVNIGVRDWYQICVRVRILITKSSRETTTYRLMMIYAIACRYLYSDNYKNGATSAGLKKSFSNLCDALKESENNLDNDQHLPWLHILSKIGDLNVDQLASRFSSNPIFNTEAERKQFAPITSAISAYASNNRSSYFAAVCLDLRRYYALT